MTLTADDCRHQASAIRGLAVSRIDWTKNPNVVKRYAHAPHALEGMAADAQEALRGAETLLQLAGRIEKRGSA